MVFFTELPVASHPKIRTCAGGATRADSVLSGLASIAGVAAPNDWVLVHDAARPGIDNTLINRLIDQLRDSDVGGLLALPARDTLKHAEGKNVVKTVDRTDQWCAQTPQMFRYALLKEALEKSRGVVTDESQAVEQLGHRPLLIKGALQNLKITHPEDFSLMEKLLETREKAEA